MRIFFLLVIFLSSCSDSSSDNNLFDLPSGLLFVGTSVDYSSSGLYFLDDANKLTELLKGQSSDFSILPLEDGFLAVNRSVADRSYRLIQRIDQQIHIGPQTSLDFLTAGDPSAAFLLEPEVFLLSSLSTGSLYLLNKRTGEPSAVEIDTDILDLPFRPVGIQRINERIFVIHQGLDENYRINNTQMIFELSWNGSEIKFIDLNPAVDGIQGIKLFGSVPTKIQALKDGRLVMASWCSAYVGEGCQSVYEEILIEKGVAKQIMDLAPFSILQVNSSFIHGNGDLFVGGESEVKERKFFQTNEADRTVLNNIHDYPKEHSYNGLFGAFSDDDTRLWIGDAEAIGEGKFDIYENFKWKEEVRLPTVPSLSGFYVR